jgi:hydrogenase maturation protease
VPRVLIIGYGNPLRGDDGFGRLAAELIAQRHLPDVEVIVSHQLGPELAASLREADHAVFLDAEAADDSGALRAAAVEPRAISPTAISHQFSPGGLLALTSVVYGRAPAATLVTAAASAFEHGAEIRPAVRAAAATAANAIAMLARQGRVDTDAVRAALPRPA